MIDRDRAAVTLAHYMHRDDIRSGLQPLTHLMPPKPKGVSVPVRERRKRHDAPAAICSLPRPVSEECPHISKG
jgi:hypothetical protein